jgi:prophage regulatory protein
MDANKHSSFPEIGFVRLQQIIAPHGPIPVSASSWWSGIKAGRFPKPVKVSTRITAWRVSDIRALIDQIDRSQAADCRDCAGGGRNEQQSKHNIIDIVD